MFIVILFRAVSIFGKLGVCTKHVCGTYRCWGYIFSDIKGDELNTRSLSITQHSGYPPLKLPMSTVRGSKKRKTRSAALSLQCLGIKTEDIELDDSNHESFEEMEVDNDALARLDLLE